MTLHTPDFRELLEAQLWDLRSHAEAKLRCLTKVQELMAGYQHGRDSPERTGKVAAVVRALREIVTISVQIQNTAADALATARQLT